MCSSRFVTAVLAMPIGEDWSLVPAKSQEAQIPGKTAVGRHSQDEAVQRGALLSTQEVLQ